MTNTALTLAPERGEITQDIDIFRLGEVFSKSGYFTDAKDASQAIVKILAGREIGIGAMASMTGFHIVQGKPTLAANLIASIIKNKKSGYNYRVLELSETVCEIEFFESGESIGKSRFTIEEAQNAGLTGKDVWKKFPKNMLFARAVSNGAKWFCPDVFNGATIYTPEELGAEVNSEGEVVNFPAHQPLTKTKLIEAAAPLDKDETQFITEAEQKMREEIIALSNALGKSEVTLASTLKFFDANSDRRGECLNKVQTAARDIVKKCVGSDDWGYSEYGTEKFLAEFGIEAIDEAKTDSLVKCLNELSDLGMV